MTLQISLSPVAEARLRQRAVASGQDVSSYAQRLLDEALRKPTLDEILAPVREEFETSGMTEDELSELLETAKHEMRLESNQVGP